MSGKSNIGRWDSEGHDLIGELLGHLQGAKALSSVDREVWIICLNALMTASNQEKASEQFFRLLNLKYKEGNRHGPTEERFYRIERLIYEGYSKTDAFKETTNNAWGVSCKSWLTIKNEYYEFRKSFPLDASRIVHLAHSHSKDGRAVADGVNFLPLYLAQCRSLELQANLS